METVELCREQTQINLSRSLKTYAWLHGCTSSHITGTELGQRDGGAVGSSTNASQQDGSELEPQGQLCSSCAYKGFRWVLGFPPKEYWDSFRTLMDRWKLQWCPKSLKSCLKLKYY